MYYLHIPESFENNANRMLVLAFTSIVRIVLPPISIHSSINIQRRQYHLRKALLIFNVSIDY